MSRQLTLVLGGARSGKSAWAEAAVISTGLAPVYLATAQALDGEMATRIAQHRARRFPPWRTVEEPLALAAVLRTEAHEGHAVLVDCLTLWLTNLLLAGRDVAAEQDALLGALAAVTGPVILVSNEVGLGIVPMDALTRAFVDHAGRLHQAIAARAERVVFMAAGLPLVLKAG